MFGSQKGEVQTISVSQALLILIDKYRRDEKAPQNSLKELRSLYFLGAVDDAARDKILLKWLKDDALRNYRVSTDFNIINEDASRRYFETHLAFHTLNKAIKSLDIKDVDAHYKSLMELVKKLPITSKVADDFINCRFSELEKNDNLNDGDKVNIKEYSSVISKLNLNYAREKSAAEFALKTKQSKAGDLKQVHAKADEENEYSHFSKEDKRKLELLALCSFITTIINKDIKNLALDIYGQGFYEPKNRGQVKKLTQEQVHSQHFGLMKSTMPVPLDDVARSPKSAGYNRPTDRYAFQPQSLWAIDNFSRLVHPFSCSISGTMLLHLRVFKELHNRGMLAINDLTKFVNYIKTFIPFMIYNSGGHSFHEFTYPLGLSPVKTEFSFINKFGEINAESLFMLNNDAAFDKALQSSITYNNALLRRNVLLNEVKLVGEKPPKLRKVSPSHSHIVTKNKHQKFTAWTLPTVSITEAVLTRKSNPMAVGAPDTKTAVNTNVVADSAKEKNNNYTILDSVNVTYRDVSELAELYSITKEQPRSLVAFRPERAAWHEAIVSVSTMVQVKDADDLYFKVSSIYEACLEEIDIASRRLEKRRIEIEKIISKIIQEIEQDVDFKAITFVKMGVDQKNSAEYHNKNQTATASAGTAAAGAGSANAASKKHSPYVHYDMVRDFYIELKTKFQDQKIGEFVPGYTLGKAIIALWTDRIYREEASVVMSKIFDMAVRRAVSKKTFQSLDVPESTKRVGFLIAGGQASGKGGGVAKLRYWAEQEGINWSNVVKLNSDIYKPLLLQPGVSSAELYSQLAQDEAAEVHGNIQRKLIAMAEKGKTPHFFADQVAVDPIKINLALTGGGKVKAIIVSTDVAVAVERSFARGLESGDTGRYENTRGILLGHKNMTTMVPLRLKENIGKAVFIQIVDNNVPEGQQPRVVFEIDLKQKKGILFDRARLERFGSKMLINPDATSPENLYLGKVVLWDDFLRLVTDGGVMIEDVTAAPAETLKKKYS